MKLAHKLSVALVATCSECITGTLWVAQEARLGREEAGAHLVTMGQTSRPALVHSWARRGATRRSHSTSTTPGWRRWLP